MRRAAHLPDVFVALLLSGAIACTAQDFEPSALDPAYLRSVTAPNAPVGLEVIVVDEDCPAPLSGDHGDCYLVDNLALGKTLALDEDVAVDCRGKTLAPFPDAQDGPQAAFLVLGVEDTVIENCVIDGFSTGVLYADVADAEFVGNQVVAAYFGALLVDASDVVVAYNDVHITNLAGAGVAVLRDSDDNRVEHNTLLIDMPPSSPDFEFEVANNLAAPVMPGTPAIYWFNSAVAIGNPTGWYQRSHALWSLYVDGRIYQFPWEPGQLAEGNRVSDNALTVLALPGEGDRFDTAVILIEGNADTSITDNTMIASIDGVGTLGHGWDLPMPGTCEGDPDLLCMDLSVFPVPVQEAHAALGQDDTCFGLGECVGAWTHRIGFWDPARMSADLRIRGNVISFQPEVADPGSGVWAGPAPGAVIEGNDVDGAFVGVGLGPQAAEDARVDDNRLSGNALGLAVWAAGARHFRARITGNDIIGSSLAAVTDWGSLTDMADVAVLNENFFGHQECPGFRAEDALDPAQTFACFAYAEPVAGVAHGHRAETCPPAPELASVCDVVSPRTIEAVGKDHGSLSIPVQFGYDGAYAAVTHGPAAPSIYEGALQPGTPDELVIQVAPGAGHVRFMLDGNVAGLLHDYDIFVFDSEWNFLAQGVNPTAFEVIDLPCDPACDTTLNVVVDPWFHDGGTGAFILYTWVLEEGPGDLAVVHAPRRAELRETDKVKVKWSGLGPGHYLGSVTQHTTSNPAGYRDALAVETLIDVIVSDDDDDDDDDED